MKKRYDKIKHIKEMSRDAFEVKPTKIIKSKKRQLQEAEILDDLAQEEIEEYKKLLK